jgi:transcriptional regulator with GAF, ATPase, and Fis domain/CHASE2 domain-containing sensor protein
MLKNSFKTPILILLPLVLVILYLIPGSLNNKILEAEISFYQWIQPSQPLSEDIVVITINDEDVELLGGWPITRDYYSYAIHALNQSGAKVIGLDVFFSGPDKRYPRYDSTMADFISSAGNVVLPMYFSEIRAADSGFIPLVGEEQHYSIPIIGHSAVANGFSNLGPDPVIYRLPLWVNSPEAIHYSFSAELWRIFNGISQKSIDQEGKDRTAKIDQITDDNGYIYLNYPDIDDFQQSYSFVSLLQTYRNDPDSIKLDGKIALIINTITGVVQIKSIPGNDNVPASFIHIAAVNNLLLQNWLKKAPPVIGCIIIFLLGLVFLVNWPVKHLNNKISIIFITPITYVVLSLFFFLFVQMFLPLLYPLISFFVGLIITKIAAAKTGQAESYFRNKELDIQLDEKENQLEIARKQLKDLHFQLNQQTQISEKNREQVIENKESISDLEKELADLRAYRRPVKKTEIIDMGGIVYGKTSTMQKVMELVMKVSADDIPVLISGETGTGKELIAQTIHQRSQRNQAPFVAINCGALPETLLESELFGHERGSFTGATGMRKGRFELADGGTVFLDEVTETSPAFQSRLLRILQESTFERVGGQRLLKTDIRIIAATNKDLQKLIDQDKFRSDLFYRLNGFPIVVPPLRERPDDIALLAEHFIKKHGYEGISGFSSQSMRILKSYSWPGNVRELENCVRRAAILAQSEERNLIQEGDLPPDIKDARSTVHLQIIHKPIEDQILELLRSFRFSRSAIAQTANLLGNRDRGTITEYFKGICFQYIVEADYNISTAVQNIVGSTDEESCENTRQKIMDYLSNLKNHVGIPPQAELPTNQQAPPFKGLPAKFDPYLDKILTNFSKLIPQ